MLREPAVFAMCPLDPMPAAPPAIAAAWLERVGSGALLGLAALLFWLCLVVLVGVGFLPADVAHRSIRVVGGVAGAVVLWLLTSPEPGNPYWLVYVRWVARVGVLMAVAESVIWAMYRYVPQAAARDLVAVHVPVHLLCTAGLAASWWYISRISRRLGDRVLRISFSVLACLGGVLLLVTMLSVAVSGWGWWWQWSHRTLERSRDMESGFRFWLSSPGWAVFFAGIFGLSGWLQWRLWRRVSAAARRLREMATEPGVEGGAGGR